VKALSIVHTVRSNLRYVLAKDKKPVAGGLKAIYRSPTESAARQALEEFAERWTRSLRDWTAAIPNDKRCSHV